MKRMIEIETEHQVKGSYAQGDYKDAPIKWAYTVDFSSISPEDLLKLAIGKWAVCHNAHVKGNPEKMIKAFNAQGRIKAETVLTEGAKVSQAFDFGRIMGLLESYKDDELTDDQIKVKLTKKGLSDSEISAVLKGENPWKKEVKKGSNLTGNGRSGNGQGISIKDIPGLDKALIDWGKAEKGTTENFVWTEESLNNVLKNANCPEKYAGIAKIYVRMNVAG